MSATITEYDDALRWIFDRINYERVSPQRSSEHFRPERVERLLDLIGAPQLRIPVIHIAGTKGKGSTAAILESIVRASGIRCGLYTSPHIHRFEERMVVDGCEPDPSEMVSMVSELQQLLAEASTEESDVTYFEVATLLAWMFFDRKNIELAVLETGLGGRLDTTNVCQPLVTIITAIGLDHTSILGNTIEQIAGEKAGIIKRGIPVITSAAQPDALNVIKNTAAEHECPIWTLPGNISVTSAEAERAAQLLTIRTPERTHQNIHLPLAGQHQGQNAALAVAAADILSRDEKRITQDSVAAGVSTTNWPMRFEIVEQEPTVVLDVAHNPDAVAALAETFKAVFPDNEKAVLLFGSSKDKNSRMMLRILAPLFDSFVFTEFRRNPRATEVAQLAAVAEEELTAAERDAASCISTAPTPQDAFIRATDLAGKSGIICVAGSFFLAAEVREIVLSDRNQTS